MMRTPKRLLQQAFTSDASSRLKSTSPPLQIFSAIEFLFTFSSDSGFSPFGRWRSACAAAAPNVRVFPWNFNSDPSSSVNVLEKSIFMERG